MSLKRLEPLRGLLRSPNLYQDGHAMREPPSVHAGWMIERSAAGPIEREPEAG